MLVTPSTDPVAKIKVVGIGGAGGNSINTMISDYNIEGVEFYAFNSDAQALKNSLAPVTLQLGAQLTRGLGVGGDHTLGAQSAEESLDEIHEHLAGADMVFVTAGMGGGTGTGAAPVVAGVAKNLGALTVGVVTKPFNFEGKHRQQVAEVGLNELKDKVDTLIVIPNQRLLDVIDDSISFLEAMKQVDRVLAEGVSSISRLVTQSGFINVDFADVRAIMTDAGTALMGIGKASGENRAEDAAREATNSPLLDMSIEGATGVLFNVVGGMDMSMKELDLAAQLIQDAVDPSANIIFGATVDPNMKEELIITIVATGFDSSRQVFTSKGGTQTQQSTNVPMTLVQGDSPITPTKPAPSTATQNDDYDDYYEASKPQPTVHQSPKPSSNNSGPKMMDDKDELEVPAFMRRKRE